MSTYKKAYTHLHTDLKPGTPRIEGTVPVGSASTPTPPPSTTHRPPSTSFTPRSSNLPKLIIVILIAVIVYLVYSLIAKNFTQCARLPGSHITPSNPATCTTFYGKTFTQSESETPGFNSTITPSTSLYPTPEANFTPGAELSPVPTVNPNIPTTKGGLPLESPTPATRISQPTTNPTPVPTTAPTSNTSIPSDWVKHNYPSQHLAFWLPPGWTGSVATHNINTNVTNFNLGGPGSINVTLQPNWNNIGDAQNKPINYEVKGISAIKVVGSDTTTVYFQKDSIVYIFACNNNLWSTCNTIITNLEFI